MSIRITEDTATPALQEMINSLQDRSVFFKVWGNAVAKKARANARANSKGGRFWHSIAKATRLHNVTDHGATISNDHVAGAHKHYGGTIKPKNGKFLAIPASDNHNKQLWPSEYADGQLFFIRSGKQAFLFDQTDGALMFILVPKVTQKAQPWWPSDADVMQLGSRNGEKWIDKLTQ